MRDWGEGYWVRVREFLHCIPWAEGDEKGGGGGTRKDEVGMR